MTVQCKNQTKTDFKDLFSSLSYSLLMLFQELLIFERSFYWNFTYSPLFQWKWKLEINITYQTFEFCSGKFYVDFFMLTIYCWCCNVDKVVMVFLYSVGNYLLPWKLPLVESNSFNISKGIIPNTVDNLTISHQYVTKFFLIFRKHAVNTTSNSKKPMLKPGNQGKPKRRIKAVPSEKSTEAVVQRGYL